MGHWLKGILGPKAAANPAAGSAVPKTLLFERDAEFLSVYEAGLRRTATPDNKKRPPRFYNLLQFLDQSLDLPGNAHVAECGCYRGLSSFLMLNWMARRRPGYRGADFHIFDSFKGLSEPAEHDRIREKSMVRKWNTFAKPAGSYAAAEADVRAALSEFPEVSYHEGWIPQSLEKAGERAYRFVHFDLDLYEPTHGALEYFYPRLISGGIAVFDEYGSLKWPGAQKAVDEFCAEKKLRPLPLSTGQAVLWKK